MSEVYRLVGSIATEGRDSHRIGATFEEVTEFLTKIFSSYEDPQKRVRLVCLLIGRPTSQLVLDQLIPDLDYWHCRSGEHMDFFCIGFSSPPSEFAPESFNRAIRYLEKKTKWRYSGQTDFILANAKYYPPGQRAILDYSSAVVLTLEGAISEGVIKSVPAFFEQIIACAEKSNGYDPAWGFSDAQGQGLLMRALKRLLLTVVPEAARAEAAQAFMLAVRNIER